MNSGNGAMHGYGWCGTVPVMEALLMAYTAWLADRKMLVTEGQTFLDLTRGFLDTNPDLDMELPFNVIDHTRVEV